MSLLGQPWDWFKTWRGWTPLTDDEIRRLYHANMIDARTNRDAIHGRGRLRGEARDRVYTILFHNPQRTP